MALNLTNLFTALGRIGRNAYLINSGAQDLQETPFNSLVGYAYINPAWVAPLTSSYDMMIRQESQGMSVWAQAAVSIVQGFVAADSPTYGTSISASLSYLNEQMIAQGKTIDECTIGSTVTADSANVGEPKITVSLKRYDGLIFQNTVAESARLLFTSDSYTGSATVGREPWTITGEPNVSSLGTGAQVGVWDWDYPQGSGQNASGNCIDASQDATTSGNLLTNGDFEDWTGSAPAVLDHWCLTTGTWGTSITRSGATDGIDGGYCVTFNAGATLNTLTTEFNSDEDDGTDVNAGTTAALASLTAYTFNVWLKAGGVISGGVLTVSLVDSAGNVIADQAGTNNTTAIALTAWPTTWTAQEVQFRTPIQLPADGIVRLKVGITTALAGATLLMDYAALAKPTSFYVGGPLIAAFSNPEAPVETGDEFTVALTNNRSGATFGATFQTLLYRLFQTPSIIFPYSGAPDYADTLITSA